MSKTANIRIGDFVTVVGIILAFLIVAQPTHHHGLISDNLAALLFPYALAMGRGSSLVELGGGLRLIGDIAPLVVLFAQFPVYGFALDLASQRGAFASCFRRIAALHLLAALGAWAIVALIER